MKLNFSQHMENLQARMVEHNVGLVFLPPGANLFYLAGIPHRDVYRTDHNAYGDWIVGGYIGQQGGVTLVSPRMGGDFYQAQASLHPWIEQPVRVVNETEQPLEVLRQVLGRFDLAGKRVALEDHAWAETALAYRRLLPENELVLASALIAPLRMIKEPAALELMRRAGQICEAAFEHALARLKLGVTAWEVECEVDYQMRRMGAEFSSFPTNITFLNPLKDPERRLGKPERRLEPGDAVAFDFGCVYQGCVADFGRTAFAGDLPDEMLRIHALVSQAQEEGIKALLPGRSAGDVDRFARQVIAEGGYGPAFRHRLGHGIGVSVHEPPFLDGVDATPLQENMTFTVEPSIYVQGGYGCRVEDVVLVTAQGGVPLYGADRRLYRVG